MGVIEELLDTTSREEIVNDEEYWFIKEEYLKALGGMSARLRLVAQVDSEELTLVNKYQ